ncbi:MAG: sarcosine oxidase subunit delta, partial [Candidatus Puniceispirillaceae bacterium]
MLIINCPYCGPREESEFACGGEAHIARPLAENSISDAEFADYLFLRDNPKGRPEEEEGAAGVAQGEDEVVGVAPHPVRGPAACVGQPG